MKQALLSRQQDIVVQELKDEILIYDLRVNKAFCLNETSALVWQACDGRRSIDEIRRFIGKKMNSPVTEDLIWLAIDQLKRNNLLAESESVEVDFKGLTRREAIRRAGLASMVVLPLISSLVAPTAAHAQSGAVSCSGFCGCSFPTATYNPATDTSCGTGNIEAFCTSGCTCVVNKGGCFENGGNTLCEGTCIDLSQFE
jgi:hypothetical protein